MSRRKPDTMDLSISTSKQSVPATKKPPKSLAGALDLMKDSSDDMNDRAGDTMTGGL